MVNHKSQRVVEFCKIQDPKTRITCDHVTRYYKTSPLFNDYPHKTKAYAWNKQTKVMTL